MTDTKTHKTLALCCAVIAAFALAITAGPALAQGSQDAHGSGAKDPTSQQYADSLTGAENSAGADQPAASSPASSGTGHGDGGGLVGSLPFTGTDLIGLAAIAICMLATGFLLNSLARPRRQ